MPRRAHLLYNILAVAILVMATAFSRPTQAEQVEADHPGQGPRAFKEKELEKKVAQNRDAWLAAQAEHMLINIVLDDHGNPTGAVEAGTSDGTKPNQPDYKREWGRDSAIFMRLVVDRYLDPATPPDRRAFFRKLLIAHAYRVRNQQVEPNWSDGLNAHDGEPLWRLDGGAFDQGWGRPQNDSPALRVSALIAFWQHEIPQWHKEDAKMVKGDKLTPDEQSHKELMDVLGTNIRQYLDYINASWQRKSFDPWEEKKSPAIFFTLRVMQKALLDGIPFQEEEAAWKEKHGDPQGAKLVREKIESYRDADRKIDEKLETMWNNQKKYLAAHLPPYEDDYDKLTDLDVQVILGSLFGKQEGPFSPHDYRLLSTIARFKQAMLREFPVINSDGTGTHYGRYEGDLYQLFHRVDRKYRTDAKGNVINYKVDASGDFVYDKNQQPIPDPKGRPLHEAQAHPWSLATAGVAQALRVAAIQAGERKSFQVPLTREFFELILGVPFSPKAEALSKKMDHIVVTPETAEETLGIPFNELTGRVNDEALRTAWGLHEHVPLSWSHSEEYDRNHRVADRDAQGKPVDPRLGGTDLGWSCAAIYRMLEKFEGGPGGLAALGRAN